MTQRNDALLRLMKLIEQEIAIRTEQHVGYQPLPPEPTRQEQIEWPVAFLLNRPLNLKLRMEVPNSLGFYREPIPNDPESIVYLGPNHARPKRKFRLFRRREKPHPKQEHVSLFEVLPDGPYARCICGEIIEREETHICLDRRLSSAVLVDAGGNPIRVGDIVDKWLISRDSR